MMFFGGLGVIAMVFYLVVFVLVVMFLFRGIVYFRSRNEADQALLQRLDRLIETLDKENHNNSNGNE